ncbi:ATP-binding protein [Streptomyces sp. NPDC085927]|uniref:ATP-binding protein n=1 Tax=Streptomyces sp. NPDC085927 TaxID=3365738 RepID=UPI0037D05834
MAAHQLALSVPATANAVSTARHQAVNGIRRWNAEWDDDVEHTAALVISELLTNAVQHAGTGRILLALRLTGTALRIEVCDSSSLLPQPGPPDDDSETGRGLLLVSALTDRHGAEPTPTGKRCWAELPLLAPTRTDNHAFLRGS